MRADDLDKFDSKIRTLQTEATVAVTDFLNSHGSVGSSPLRELSSNRLGPSHPRALGECFRHLFQGALVSELSVSCPLMFVHQVTLLSRTSYFRGHYFVKPTKHGLAPLRLR